MNKWIRVPQIIKNKEERANLITMFAEYGWEVRISREARSARSLAEGLGYAPCEDCYVEFKERDNEKEDC